MCLSTRVQPCCADHVNGNKLSDTKVNVAGEDVTVTFYIANKNSKSTLRTKLMSPF